MGIDLETPTGDSHNACLDDSRHKTHGDAINLNSLNNLEPHDSMEFDSKEEAFSFYKEYAAFLGFTAIIKASRRSRISGKFIDAKFVCTKYGSKKEASSVEARDTGPSEDSIRVPHKKKRGRINRSWSKTDCKACLHVKRRQDGRWIIRNFVKEHNHEICPDQGYSISSHGNFDLGTSHMDALHASRARAKKMFVSMTKESDWCKNVGKQKVLLANQLGSSQQLALENSDGELMLNFFTNMQGENPYFFYAIDLNGEQGLRNAFWVEAKSRADYKNFSDVVSLDTTYVKKEYKLPFVPFIGVNHHGQFMLLGCGLIADETKSTYFWLMRAWLKAMGGCPPRVILTDQHKALKEAISEVFPSSRHCFALWHILGQISEKLGYVMRQHENFMANFNDCIFRSCTNEEFENRWWKIVDRFNLRNDIWFQSLYEDREYWVPMFMKDIFLADMSPMQRSECVNSHFDKYLQRKTTLKDFLEQYKAIIQDRCEEEAKADFETWHREPGLKSPSPFGKQMATVYTHAMFKKFQAEVLGGVACHPRKISEASGNRTFKVQDFEQNHGFDVVWNNELSDISCSCQLFESRGFLCRHVMIVLQMSGVHSIPSQYVLKRWTKDAKSREIMREQTNLGSSRAQYYKNLCLCALKLSDEGSLSEESYNFMLNALEEAFRKFESMHKATQRVAEPLSSAAHGTYECEEDVCGNNTTETKGDDGISKIGQGHPEQEVLSIGMQDGYHLRDLPAHTNSRPPIPYDYFGSQQLPQGMGQMNSIASNCDDYYTNQHNIQVQAHLNSIAPARVAHYITQQGMHGIGQSGFRQQTISSSSDVQGGLQDMGQSSVGRPQLLGISSKHLRSKHLSH